ncbi:thiamine-phosphate kinase [Aliikangiella sp. IMCC44653]
MKEFEIIQRYLNFDSDSRKDVLVGIGDDCALLKVPRGQRLAISMDTLVADVHFLADSDPAEIAHKAVAVNLSDLAAAGAEPAWLTLSLTMPKFEQAWMEKFHQGLRKMAEYYGVQIVGGDTCQGPLSITIQAHGFVPENVFHRRSGAQAGDLICVTGNLGDAALGLQVAQNKLHVCQQDASYFLKKYYTPNPRIAAGIALRGRATAVIDISDGLLSDIKHISDRSEVGALIKQEWLPLSSAAQGIQNQELVMRSVLAGGDDYELCFTVDEDALESTRLALETVGSDCIPVGRMTGKPGVRVMQDKQEVTLDFNGFEHF